MAVREGVAETLLRISKLKNKKERIAELRNPKTHNIALETIVNCCYNPNIVFQLPKGDPPYIPQPKEMDLQGNLFQQLRKIRIFVNNPDYENMKPIRREQNFIQFLETIDPDDAKLILAIKDGKMPYRNLPASLFREAWPALASTWVKKDG